MQDSDRNVQNVLQTRASREGRKEGYVRTRTHRYSHHPIRTFNENGALINPVFAFPKPGCTLERSRLLFTFWVCKVNERGVFGMAQSRGSELSRCAYFGVLHVLWCVLVGTLAARRVDRHERERRILSGHEMGSSGQSPSAPAA